MASTNHTTNYNLSQYVGSDKPTYLGDYNSDMSKIDTQMKTNADNNTITDGKIGTLSNLTTTAQSNLVAAINEVDENCDTNAGAISTTNTNIGTLANLTTTNKTSVVNAINEVDGNIKKFDLTNIETITSNDITNGTGTVSVATNSDGTIAKIYGNITAPGYPTTGYVSFNTSLRPDEEITIIGNCIISPRTNEYVQNTENSSITIKTNGDIEIPFGWFNGSTYENKITLINSILFIKDFGDVPTPPQ